MDKLYSWRIKRSGAAMTIEHSCGRITGVLLIEPMDGNIVASTKTRSFILSPPV